jgi:hypothetical protein
MEPKHEEEHLDLLRNEYRRVHTEQARLEQLFRAVDNAELVSTQTRFPNWSTDRTLHIIESVTRSPC